MNEINEKEIRERLERAVAPLDPVAPPLDLLRERAVKLRRFRISAAGGALAAAAAAVTVAVVVVPANGSQSVDAAKAPSAASLTRYVAAHDGRRATGPIVDGSHYAGAYTTKQGVAIVRYSNGAWRPDGDPITKYGRGQFILRLTDGVEVIPGHASFAVRTRGGDVSYFGGVIYDANGTWTPAKFGKCANHKDLSCAYGGTAQPYGHLTRNGTYVSISNDCKPYCAAGTDYLITWHWDASKAEFVVSDVSKYVYRSS